MAAPTGGLLALLRRAEPRSAPSGWALALDAAVAVGAAAAAVFEVAERTIPERTVIPNNTIFTWTAVAALTALPLAIRRLYPITAWLAIVAAIVVVSRATVPPIAFGVAVFAAYSAVVHSRYRNLAIAAVMVVTFAMTAAYPDTLPQFPARLTALFAIVPAVAAGLGISELRRRLSDSAARLRRAAEEQEAATRRAIEAERARIAAELHDVVTHNVSVMLVQAGAARKVLVSLPDEAAQALLAVEASGRTAIAELRNLLGLLSPAGDSDAALRPQPGLCELDALIDRISAAGLPVELHVSGTPQPLSPGADLAAYRVVQEALTNVLRHAGRAATSVILQWGEKLVITVRDSGHADGGYTSTGPPGRGLLGLRERLSLYGGELDAGLRPGGGWQVRAVIPVRLAA
jgi:signal transduction histidine kinase